MCGTNIDKAEPTFLLAHYGNISLNTKSSVGEQITCISRSMNYDMSSSLESTLDNLLYNCMICWSKYPAEGKSKPARAYWPVLKA